MDALLHKIIEMILSGDFLRPQIITWEQLTDYIYSDRTVVIDLREREEFEKSHIPGAWNLSFDELGKRIGELKRFGQIIFYCDKGTHSLMAAKRLARMGFKTCSVFGGYERRNMEKYGEV